MDYTTFLSHEFYQMTQFNMIVYGGIGLFREVGLGYIS